MEFDYSKLNQQPNNWVKTRIEYEGEGIAEFENPRGQVLGYVRISFDEFGDHSIEMQVTGVNPALPLGLPQLLSADPPRRDNGQLKVSFPPTHPNKCTRLTVATKQGEFRADNINYVSMSFGEEQTLRFHTQLSQLDTGNSDPATYWALPLVNFVSNFQQYDPRLAHHPLRIFPDAHVPEDTPAEHREVAEFISRQKSRLILFSFHNELGFIEAMPDYEKRQSQLLKRQIPCAITSVMVGHFGDMSIDMDKIEMSFPFYMLDLLALACGNEISSLWVEYRDTQGNLIRRIHGMLGFGGTLFIEGQKAIDEVIHRGTGRLLTVAQSSSQLHESYVRVALRHTILSGRNGQSLEDRMDHLCRALDAICEHYGLASQYLLSRTQPSDKVAIETAIRQATSVVESIAQKAVADGDLDQNRYLMTINGRLANAGNQDRKFGLAVCDLLAKFSLPDANILDGHIASHPRKDDSKTWADVISHLRGRVIHVGYFDFRGKKHEIEDVWPVILHLRDILLRILLSTLGYDANYQPMVIRFVDSQPLNWVQPSTTAEQLGYR